MGLAHGLFARAIIGTIAGYLLAVTLPTPLAAGLLFVTPVYFMVALVRNSSDLLDWWALGLGALLAPLARYLIGTGFDLLAAGLIGGTAAYLIQRARKPAAAAKSARDAS